MLPPKAARFRILRNPTALFQILPSPTASLPDTAATDDSLPDTAESGSILPHAALPDAAGPDAPSNTHEFLMRLKDSKLKDEALLEEYYDRIIETMNT